MLAAIRRGLRRGALPADQAAMLRARLAAHPRHLDSGALPGAACGADRAVRRQCGEGVRLGRARAGSSTRCRARWRTISPRRTCRRRHRHGAASGVAGDPLVRRGRCCDMREGRAEATDTVSVQHAFAADRRDRHADAAVGAGAADDAEPAGGYRDRGAARVTPGRRLRGGVGPAARRSSAACRAMSCW